MIITYENGEIFTDKEDYDAPKLNAYIESLGVSVISKTRQGGALIIETDQDLDQAKLDQLKEKLNKTDLKPKKK